MRFNGYRCTVLKDGQRGIVTALPFGRSCSIAVVARDVYAHPGRYEIIIGIRSRYPIYWFGTYIGARRIYLHNGLNRINIEIASEQMQFAVGLFSTRARPRDGAMIYRVLARCTEALAPNPALTSLFNARLSDLPPSPQPIQPVVPVLSIQPVVPVQPIQPVQLPVPVSPTPIITDTTHATEPQALAPNSPNPRIIFVVGTRGSRADAHAQAAHQLYVATYNTAIEYVSAKPLYQEYKLSDIKLVVKFGHTQDIPEAVDPFNLFGAAMKVMHIDSSHISVEDLVRSSLILYSSPAIRSLLNEYYSHIVYGKQQQAAFSGVDLDVFSYSKVLEPGHKLVAGVVKTQPETDAAHTKLSLILTSLPWLKFRVCDIHATVAQRRDFYRGIDVLINTDTDTDLILEAMACGRPWISMSTSLVEQIREASTDPSGIIIDNYVQLVQQLIRFKSDRSLMYKMGEVAANTARSHFGWSQQLEPLAALFDKTK